ncbi:hypothetical protein HBB16_02985 [Pseudonocardia sp. MCCB 268]|nr:hypothetical protein [Pseudonocardia cytotoxica]
MVCVLVLTVAVPLHNFVAQRQELAASLRTPAGPRGRRRAVAVRGPGPAVGPRPRSRHRPAPAWMVRPGETPTSCSSGAVDSVCSRLFNFSNT